MGLEEPGLNRVIRAGYDLLHLVTYFTVGPKEARAWTITKGTKGPAAAGVIHTDFEKGFIRAETIAYDDYVAGQRRSRCARGRQVPAGRQGLRRAGRRRDALPLCQLSDDARRNFFTTRIFPKARCSPFGTYHLTKDEVIGYAREFDPQPFHLDEEAAQQLRARRGSPPRAGRAAPS